MPALRLGLPVRPFAPALGRASDRLLEPTEPTFRGNRLEEGLGGNRHHLRLQRSGPRNLPGGETSRASFGSRSDSRAVEIQYIPPSARGRAMARMGNLPLRRRSKW